MSKKIDVKKVEKKSKKVLTITNSYAKINITD